MYKEISDLGLISAIMYLGYSPVERRKEGKRVYFTFDWNEQMSTIEKDYANHSLMGDLNGYQTMIKSVKASIYQMETNG